MDPRQVFSLIALLAFTLAPCGAKECTNTPSESLSHTVRAQTPGLWLHGGLSPAGSSRMMLEHDGYPVPAAPGQSHWPMLSRPMKGSYGVDSSKFLSAVSLHDVRLSSESVYGQAQQTNLEYLLNLDVDRLVWSFRVQAGLPAPGKPYGGWEGADVELRGHFVGHYMSATAHMWASTHNETLRKKMLYVVDALHACQVKIGTGYLSAFPTEFFDRFEAIKSVWAPYYTIHKIMAGLLDQYTLANNSIALDMVVRMAEYFGYRVKNVITKYTIERHWASLNEETGGMNDVLYNLYRVTKNERHLMLAHLFDKPCFLGLLAVEADSLSGFHANTHIPVVVGAQMRYEITGDPLYKKIAVFFMDAVNSSHTYATGGTSVGEFWSDPKHLADTLRTENEESCTTYNMLKVSRNLFRWTKEMAYADFYERALVNGVLGIQRGREPGVMIYMLPLGHGKSKAKSYHGWGTPNNSFWCCYGTGIESFSKLGDSIYFEQKGSPPALYLIQYIPSSFNWKKGGLLIEQTVKPVSSSDLSLEVVVTVSATESKVESSTLFARIPSWAYRGSKAAINQKAISSADPGTFLALSGKWGPEDRIYLSHSIGLWTEAIKDDRSEYSSLQAILFGPYLLAGLTEGSADGDWDVKIENSTDVSNWVTPIPLSHNSQLVTLGQQSGDSILVMSVSNASLTMEQQPEEGTSAAVHATFRIFSQDDSSTFVMIEPFDLPGMVITNSLRVSLPGGAGTSFRRLAPGLAGRVGSVSFELASMPGCFLMGGGDDVPGRQVEVGCQEGGAVDFSEAATFVEIAPLRQYHPISFVASGATRNFVLEPLMSLKDEFYNVYFNLKP